MVQANKENIDKNLRFEKHMYDVDIYTSLNILKKEIEKNKNFLAITTDEYITRFDYTIDYYCNKRNIDYNSIKKHKGILVIPSNEEFYKTALALTLATFEAIKIPSLLSYQKNKYKGEGRFIDVLEFLVFDMTTSFSAWKNDIRLKMIFQWIYVTRGISKAIWFPNDLQISIPNIINKSSLQNTKSRFKFEDIIPIEKHREQILDYLLDNDIIDASHKWIGSDGKYIKAEFSGFSKAITKSNITDYEKITTVGLALADYFLLDIKERTIRNDSEKKHESFKKFKKYIDQTFK